jgi:hypothetical protein
MRKLPKKINICGHNYTLILDPCLARDHNTAGNSCMNGLYITLDYTVPESVQEEVLIHEILEQICNCMDIRLDHQTISTIANNFFQVLKYNNIQLEQEI